MNPGDLYSNKRRPGASMTSERVRIDDLLFAIDWLGVYDASPEGSTEGDSGVNAGAKRRVIAWLLREVEKRNDRRKA